MSLFKRSCNHDYHISEYSNVLQLDEMGYPLRLVIYKCFKCGKTEHRWIDVPKESLKQLDEGTSVLLHWYKVNN